MPAWDTMTAAFADKTALAYVQIREVGPMGNSDELKNRAIVTVLGKDRSGIVAEVARVFADHQVNNSGHHAVHPAGHLHHDYAR